jgi:hypothetical protein
LQHLLNHRGGWPVSTSNALDDLRRRCPSCGLGDRILIDAIAGEAIEFGLDVDFDGKPPHLLTAHSRRRKRPPDGSGGQPAGR